MDDVNILNNHGIIRVILHKTIKGKTFSDALS